MFKNRTEGIFEYLNISGIEDGYSVRFDGIKTYYYRLKYNIDNDWINEDISDGFINDNSGIFSALPPNYLCRLIVLGFDNSDKMSDNLKKYLSDNEIINEYINNKLDFIKPYKSIHSVLTITPIGEFKDDTPVVNKLKLEPLSAVEIYNILFNILNPGLYSDKLERTPITYKEIVNPDISIPMTLTKTPIIEYDNRLAFDDISAVQFYMPIPPNTLLSEFTLGGAINTLSGLKSNFFISVGFRNLSGYNPLGMKKSFASTGLLSALGPMNYQIAKSINDYEKKLIENNISATQMSLQIVLFNSNEDELYKESKIIKTGLVGFEGSVFCPSVLTRYEDYMAMIPSVVEKFKYSFIVSAEQIATILMFPEYDLNSATIFEKKGRILTSFDISNFKRTNKPGAMIFAPSGSGKSAFLNYIYNNLLLQHKDMESLIIDFGGSYRSLYEILNRDDMIYTDMQEEGEDVYFNPFDLEFGKPVTEKMINNKVSVLSNFIGMALNIPKDEDKYDVLIQKACFTLYNTMILAKDEDHRNRINEREYRSLGETGSRFYIDRYNDSEYSDFNSFSKAMPTFTDLVTVIMTNENIRQGTDEKVIKEFNEMLSGFISLPTSKIFSTYSSSFLMARHLIADLKSVALKNEKTLSLLLVYLINSKLLSYMNAPDEDKLNPRFIIIDEYNQFKKRSDFIDKVADTIFKTGRKENIHLILITQNIKDYNPEFFNNCGRMISFAPDKPSELEELAKLIDEKTENLKALVKNIGTVQGEYSEMLVMNSDKDKTKNFYRLKVSPFEYYAFITTSGEDRAERSRILSENGNDWLSAVKTMANSKNNKSSK